MDDIFFFKRSINSDVYLGQSAGKVLLQDIKRAKKSVKVISPDVSPLYVETLICLKESGVDVQLITMDKIKDNKDLFRKKTITRLIQKEPRTGGYRQLFPFKVFVTPLSNNSSGYYNHSKVFIIDDSVVYLGSLNLTLNGIKNNFESWVRIVEKEAIHGLNQLFKQLFNSNENECVPINYWVKQMYAEFEK